MSISDEELIARVVKRGDQHAFSQLVLRYQSQLRNWARRLCNGDTHLADDPGVAAALRANYPGEFSEGQIVEEMRRIDAEEEAAERQVPVEAGEVSAGEGTEV